MGKFFKFVAVVLLVTWLPATQHAALEMMGILPDHSELVSHHHGHGHEENSEPHGSHDATHEWHFVEKTIAKPSTELLKSPLFSALFAITLLCCLSAAVLKLREDLLTRIEPHVLQRPLGWVPDWHFVRRAAPSPRAPAPIA